MFSKELENLIQATLEDGILEDYEKAALVKRAQAEGVDLTELEIYINSLLQKRQKEIDKEHNEFVQRKAQEKKEAIGPVCPKCGKQVPPMTLKCDCGYEFVNNRNNSSTQLLYERISKIQSQPLINTDSMSPEYRGEMKQRTEQILSLIQLFPVPNTKEDIMDFLALAAPNSKQKGGIFGTIPQRLIVLGILAVIIIFVFFLLDPPGHGRDSGVLPLLGGIYVIAGAIAGAFLIDRDTLKWNKSAAVWRAKFYQVLMKGRSLRGDTDFQRQLDYYEQLINKK